MLLGVFTLQRVFVVIRDGLLQRPFGHTKCGFPFRHRFPSAYHRLRAEPRWPEHGIIHDQPDLLIRLADHLCGGPAMIAIFRHKALAELVHQQAFDKAL